MEPDRGIAQLMLDRHLGSRSSIGDRSPIRLLNGEHSERLNPQPLTVALCRLTRRPKYGYPCQGEAATVVPCRIRCNG